MSSDNPTPEERWRPIFGFSGYEVSDLGNVRSMQRPGRKETRLKTLTLNAFGYKKVNLSRMGSPKSLLVHRLVANAFLGPLDPSMVVNHKDKDRQNNKLSNLEIVNSDVNYSHSQLYEWVRLAVRQELRELLDSRRL